MKKKLKIRFGPDGMHLFDRNSGINILIDEIKPQKQMWSIAPRLVSIALTNSCSLKCPYCYSPKTDNTLDPRDVYAWTKELDSMGGLGIAFGGGEPTLYDDFGHLCKKITENTGLAVGFTTSGHYINDKLASDLKGNVHFIRISMDGLHATYENLRGKSFDLLLNKIEMIRDIAPFGINYVVNSTTLPDLNSAMTLASELGAKDFLLLPEISANGRDGIDEFSILKLQNIVKKYSGKLPLCISESKADGFTTCNPLKNENSLRAYAHIDASRNIKRTSFEKHGISIREDGVIAALKMLNNSQGENL